MTKKMKNMKKIRMKRGVEVNKLERRKEKKTVNEGAKVPYPVVPSKKEKDCHLARFLDIFRKLEITMPFREAL